MSLVYHFSPRRTPIERSVRTVLDWNTMSETQMRRELQMALEFIDHRLLDQENAISTLDERTGLSTGFPPLVPPSDLFPGAGQGGGELFALNRPQSVRMTSEDRASVGAGMFVQANSSGHARLAAAWDSDLGHAIEATDVVVQVLNAGETAMVAPVASGRVRMLYDSDYEDDFPLYLSTTKGFGTNAPPSTGTPTQGTIEQRLGRYRRAESGVPQYEAFVSISPFVVAL